MQSPTSKFQPPYPWVAIVNNGRVATVTDRTLWDGIAGARPTSEVARRDVVVLRWPDDSAEVDRLAAARLPRLLLVEETADPPESGDCEEDWIRLPADDRDVGARLRALARRAARHQALPELDEYGRLHHRSRWVSPSSPIDQRIIAVLVERFGAVVSAEELIRRAWPEGPSTNLVLRAHLTRLRKRIEPLGLDIRNVRESGYVLEERGAGKAM